jgi:acetyltransferase
MTSNSLDALFTPKSVAVVGASGVEGKVGFSVMRNIKRTYTDGEVYPINPKADEILGYKAYKSISEVPGAIDLVIICIPAKLVIPVAEECGKKGVKALVVITAGFKEVGGEGVQLEKKLNEISQQYKMRVVGPNCLGIITGGNFTFAGASPDKGEVAMLSQSGAMATGLLDWAAGKVGFSAFISLGNKMDVDEIDFIEYLANDDNTKVICAYIESVKNGPKFMEIVSRAAQKKPIIILKSGRSAQGAKAASSHTGALAGSDIAFDLAFKKAGVIRADTISDLFNYALTFLIAPIPKGEKFAIVTNAGGPGIITTDAMEKYKVGFAQFTEETVQKLKAGLPAESNFYNPVDIIGDAPPERYYYALEKLCETPTSEVAGAIILLTPQAQTDPVNAANKIVDIRKKFPDRVLVASFIGEKSVREPARYLTKSGVPTYDFPEDAVKVLKGLDMYGKIQKMPLITDKKVPTISINRTRIEEIFENARKDKRAVLLSVENSEIFKIYGINHPVSRLASTARDAFEIANDVGFPCVAKIVSPQIIHKFDVGGVVLNITSAEQAKEAFMQIMSNVAKLGPKDARIYGVEIQKMVTAQGKKKKNELIIGMSRDPQWGPMLMIGSGGIYANYVKDVAFDLAYHFDRQDALDLLQQTKIYRILEGVRGEPRSHIDGVLDTILRLSQFVNDFPEVVELDINPCLVFEDEASAVDIKITIKI